MGFLTSLFSESCLQLGMNFETDSLPTKSNKFIAQKSPRIIEGFRTD
jgi:hypothetical protein